jgi:hypothetical protein
VVFAISLLLASCGGEPRLALPEGAASSPAAAPLATPAASPVASRNEPTVGDIVWTTTTDPATNAPVDAVTAFSPDAPRIIAALPVRQPPPGAVVRATWTYNNTSLDAFATDLALSSDPGQVWISFQISRSPDVPWPEGTYAVTVSLGETIVQLSTVEVAPPA